MYRSCDPCCRDLARSRSLRQADGQAAERSDRRRCRRRGPYCSEHLGLALRGAGACARLRRSTRASYRHRSPPRRPESQGIETLGHSPPVKQSERFPSRGKVPVPAAFELEGASPGRPSSCEDEDAIVVAVSAFEFGTFTTLIVKPRRSPRRRRLSRPNTRNARSTGRVALPACRRASCCPSIPLHA